jgi:adenine-specific DNA-methyltransferase
VAEAALVRLAVALGALEVGGTLSAGEIELSARAADSTPAPRRARVAEHRRQLQAGEDPLGTAFYELRSASVRRAAGAVYTPTQLVQPMVHWAFEQQPQRVVDAGSGSGRFISAIAKKLPDCDLVAVDADPVATLMTRAALACLQVERAQVLHTDFTKLKLSKAAGPTCFIGNPPYVRHHQLSPTVKAWAQTTAKRLGHSISGLAGLHAYFFLATAAIGRPGDSGCFVTSSEWLDVNYGAIIRQLLLGTLGAESLHVVEPTALPFEGTATTAVVTTFKLGEQAPVIRVQPVQNLDSLGTLAAGEPVARQRLAEAKRWSVFIRNQRAIPEGYVELGDLCRVHRGTVTGANGTWVTRGDVDLPTSVLFPTVTRAKELFSAGRALTSTGALKRVIDIPQELDDFDSDERKALDRFLRKAKKQAVHKGYIAAHRRQWWSLGLRAPAPILATYMARRPPAFVLNPIEARHINIAHGLYPREPLSQHALTRLALSLSHGIELAQGRTYAGGLTKFEPKEMERLPVPDLRTLLGHDPVGPEVDI